MHEIIREWKKLRKLRDNGKKSQFTQLGGGLNFCQIVWNFDIYGQKLPN